MSTSVQVHPEPETSASGGAKAPFLSGTLPNGYPIKDAIVIAVVTLVVSLSLGLGLGLGLNQGKVPPPPGYNPGAYTGVPTALASAPVPSGSAISSALSQSNFYRARHHAPLFTWSDSVAADAQAWADNLASTCTFTHGGHPNEGQNLYASGGTQTAWSQVIDAWYNEVSAYKFTSTPWTDNSANFAAIGHFTQIVWVSTTSIGCGMATNSACNRLTSYYVCNFSPPGNIADNTDFYNNVLPA